MVKIGIVTVSDASSRGEREDKSGLTIKEMVKDLGEVAAYEVVPDEIEIICRTLKRMIDGRGIDLILSTGGTGISPRDVTPEATRQVVDKEIPGFGEIMRKESFKVTPHAILSRAMAGVRGNSLIINLPGSPGGVKECLALILPALPHALDLIKGRVSECARGGHRSIK